MGRDAENAEEEALKELDDIRAVVELKFVEKLAPDRNKQVLPRMSLS